MGWDFTERMLQSCEQTQVGI
uniref:Uncharacterized protein n=1 Tax=Anguilla anguilla TaxID=7936 RepID=A0A0E9VBC4_ANGAN